jgi:hypothetical protein
MLVGIKVRRLGICEACHKLYNARRRDQLGLFAHFWRYFVHVLSQRVNTEIAMSPIATSNPRSSKRRFPGSQEKPTMFGAIDGGERRFDGADHRPRVTFFYLIDPFA